MALTNEVTAQRLREVLAYDSMTGAFTRLVRTSSRANVGDVAGSKDRDGYIQISVFCRRYSAHRLAWLHAHGGWPIGDIDHINGDRADNRIGNLRDVSRGVNMQNQRRARSNSGHGFLGVSRNGKRWQAQITVDGKQRYIGQFDTPQLAQTAYIDAKRELHVGCTI